MNTSITLPTLAPPIAPAALIPEGESLLIRCLQGLGLTLLLAMLSLYIPGLPPKLLFFVCLLTGATVWRTWLDQALWPLIALCIYTVAMGALYSRSQPGKLDAFEIPGYQLAGVFLVWSCLRQRNPAAVVVLLFACLGVSLIGVLGELAGYDMTSLLPISVPNEEFFDAITTTASGESRLRGFFPEASVLGASTVSYGFVATAACLILARKRNSVLAYLAALISGVLLLFFLGITLAKTGILMLFLGGLGFVGVNFVLGSWALRMKTALVSVLLFGLVVILFYSDTPLGSYLQEQAEVMPFSHAISEQGQDGGTATRTRSWKLAYVNLKAHPFGVGHWGLGTTISASTGITPTPEMLHWFNQNNFSLKNSLANIIAETGLVGTGILAIWMYLNLVLPALKWGRRKGKGSLEVAGLYGACLLLPIGLLVSCELYPYLAYMLLLKVMADSVAGSMLEYEQAEAVVASTITT